MSAIRRAWIPALLWLMVIACESAFGASERTGPLLASVIHFFWPGITPDQFDLLHGALRKAGHFFGYAMLSLFFFRAWWSVFALRQGESLASWRDMWRRWSMSAASVALASTVLVAALDEWNQAIMPGRTSSIRDVLLDSSAALCMQMLIVATSGVQLKNGSRGLRRVNADHGRTVVGS